MPIKNVKKGIATQAFPQMRDAINKTIDTKARTEDSITSLTAVRITLL
jgi:hypothetical protein